MPLPENGTAWPPKWYASQLARIEDNDAWYSGDPDRLADAYKRRQVDAAPHNRPSQMRGGVVGKLSRWFWGQPTPNGEKRTKIHMPLAADIATASADLLFSKPPSFVFDNNRNSEAWDELDDQMRLNSLFNETAEVVAALGGGFLRVGADPEFWNHPIASAVHPDNALPEFRWGRLVAVTFVRVIETSPNSVLRYLERHELVPGAPARAIEYHGLYLGTVDKLGRRQPLDSHPFTEGLDDELVHDQPILPVVHIPNMLPSREDRSNELGRSDFEGVVSLFDAIDEVATSLMRDVRLGKGRAFIPSSYLQNLGRGGGTSWDPDAEIYKQLDIPPTQDAGITIHQFAIRVDEHVRTMEQLTRQATRTAGYSASTFGLESAGGGDTTATEVNDRKSRSAITRNKKTAYWSEALRTFAQAVMYSARQFSAYGGVDPTDLPEIQWPDVAEVDPFTQAQTLQALEAARAISTLMKVKSLHPDWDDQEVEEEVARINDEGSLADPITLTGPQAFGEEVVEEQPPNDPTEQDEANAGES